MTSTELRRIVGAMSKPNAWISGDVGVYEDPDGDHDLAFARGPMLDLTKFSGNVANWKEQARLDSKAVAALANHADALVKLVEAVEEWKACTAKGFGSRAERDLQAALAAVHVVRSAP